MLVGVCGGSAQLRFSKVQQFWILDVMFGARSVVQAHREFVQVRICQHQGYRARRLSLITELQQQQLRVTTKAASA